MLGFEIAGQVVVFEQDAVLERLMPAFDLALCLRMAGSAANVPHAGVIRATRQIAGDVAGAVVAEQPWLVHDPGLVTARCRERHLQACR